jgi:hypothetical protein
MVAHPVHDITSPALLVVKVKVSQPISRAAT